MSETSNVMIPLKRYEELVKLESKVDAAVGLIAMNDYVKTETILLILGTDLAFEKFLELREGEKKKIEELNNKYFALKEGDSDD